MCHFLFTFRLRWASALLLLALSASMQAGGEIVPPVKSHFDGQSTFSLAPSTTQEWVILHRPYLKIVGPTGLRFSSPEEPALRQPPRMAPVRKAPPEDPIKPETPPFQPVKITTLPEPTPAKAASPSVLNPDEQSTILPPLPAATPTPAATNGPMTAPPDALNLPNAGTDDLSNALIYLNAPNASGVNTTVVAPLALEPQSTTPQPPSSATYEVK